MICHLLCNTSPLKSLLRKLSIQAKSATATSVYVFKSSADVQARRSLLPTPENTKSFGTEGKITGLRSVQLEMVSTSNHVNAEDGRGSFPGLKFNEPLSWRAGRPIAIAELLRRLQTLSKELAPLDQDESDKDSFIPVAKELVSPNLLAHKDNGVKAWTACCLVDILRLCAPDAPFTERQLKVGKALVLDVGLERLRTCRTYST